MRHRRQVLVALAVVLGAAGAVGCRIESPFARTNPFDAGGDVSLSLTGPDTVRGRGARFQMTLVTSHPFPPGDPLIRWSSSLPLLVVSAGRGEFVVTNDVGSYLAVEITAQLDSRLVGKTVIIGPPAP